MPKLRHLLDAARLALFAQPEHVPGRLEGLENRVLLSADPMDFSNVAIGGGSYVTNVEIHKQDSDLWYAATDIGGIWRYDKADNRVEQLLDWIPYEKSDLYGVTGLAVDDTDVNVVAATLGKYNESWSKGYEDQGLYISYDQGQNWAKMGPTLHQEVNAGGERGNGRFGTRVVFDPSDSRYLVTGSTGDGTWVMDRGGNTYDGSDDSWSRIDSIPNGIRTQAIVFDPSNASNVYVAVRGEGVYRTDGGRYGNFTRIANSPTNMIDMEITGDGNQLLVATDTGITKLTDARFGSGWTDASHPYGGRAQTLERDPSNPQRFYTAYVATNALGSVARSDDAGDSWSVMTDINTDQNIDWHLDFYPGRTSPTSRWTPTTNRGSSWATGTRSGRRPTRRAPAATPTARPPTGPTRR